LQKRVRRRPRLRLRRRRPVAEGEESDVFHGEYMGMIVQPHSSNLKNSPGANPVCLAFNCALITIEATACSLGFL
jgi:hypothetical protein